MQTNPADDPSQAGKTSNPAVIIYADPLLTPSATFVRSQAEALRDFAPWYAGARLHRGQAIRLPPERTITINEAGTRLGKIREIPLKVFGYAPLFFRRIEQLKPALVHAHSGPAALTALPLARYLKVPLVTTFHGSEVTADRKKVGHHHYTYITYSRRLRTLQLQGALFIAISNFVLNKLLEQGYPKERTVCHYIGVDTEFFRPDEEIKREPIVLFVGTLHEVKGCEYLLQAMTKVQAVMPQAELIILGDGPSRFLLERAAKQKLKRFRFLGTQPPETVRYWMNRAKVFSGPSVKADSGATEAFGLVFAESQAMKLPVVSFASGGIPEAVAHGETGFLAAEKDWGKLADYIALLLTDDTLWQRMSLAGRRRVEEHFDLEKQTRVLEELYRSVLHHRTVSQESRLPGLQGKSTG